MKTFLTKNEKTINDKFKKKGYVICKAKSESYKYINDFILKVIKKNLKIKNPDLNKLHKLVKVNDLNEFRLNLIYQINRNSDFKFHYFNMAREKIYELAGNELMMQKNINLSIQFPHDSSSLLPIHSDVWSGDSPYEINLWVPLVNCYKTKSMYILNPTKNLKFMKRKKKKYISSDEIYKYLKKDLEWINIKKNNFLLFDQTLPHGNVINLENETRVSMNCRFKSIFSPYGDKKIGEFFVPITSRSITDLGNKYKNPFE
ncbi:hypothetical protein HIMB114_00009010 [alpha proteobacterium HIMB114]|nr:hypothetical protein HIMB114_00009010 [alpha proteobacterium HIMB114]